MSKVLFESKVKIDGSFFKKYLVLDEKKFEIKKKKSLFSSDFEVLETYLIKDIKMTNSRILVRVKDVKYVEIIMNNKTLLLKFSNEDLANDFSNKLIELKEKDSMFLHDFRWISLAFLPVKGLSPSPPAAFPGLSFPVAIHSAPPIVNDWP